MKNKKIHTFSIGDVVRRGGKNYVVSETKGWLYKPWKNEDGSIDQNISLSREIGAVSLLSKVSECKLVKRRENVGLRWWTIFPDGEK